MGNLFKCDSFSILKSNVIYVGDFENDKYAHNGFHVHLNLPSSSEKMYIRCFYEEQKSFKEAWEKYCEKI